MNDPKVLERIRPYLQIARFDHWFKNVFVLPGALVALYLDHSVVDWSLLPKIVLALLAVGFVASSNYVINEILDADKDRLHPVKKHRPVPSGRVNIMLGYVEWIALAVLGLGLAWLLGKSFFYAALALWIMGCVYNIPPLRTKEKPYLDVLSESVNNPLRLLMGWYATGTTLSPPISLVIAYWMVGAFFMAVKRLAEYRMIDHPETAAAYRSSFGHYNEERLIISILYYVAAFGLFFGIFLIRYRLEFILAIPFIAGFIAWYMHLGFTEDSPAQYPERLYKERGFLAYTVLCAVVVLALLYVDVPALYEMFAKTPSIQ